MSTLVVAVYAAEDAAEHVMAILRTRTAELPGSLDSSATVRIGADGDYTVIQTDRQKSTDAFWGVLWEALFGLIFLVPDTGTSYGTALGGLFGAIDRAGLDAEFRARVRAVLRNQTSGLALIATGWDPQPILSDFPMRPVTLIRAPLRLEQDSELIRELGGAPPSSR
jgi:uncharacterized membrane protein